MGRRKYAPGYTYSHADWAALPSFDDLTPEQQLTDARFNTRDWVSEPPEVW